MEQKIPMRRWGKMGRWIWFKKIFCRSVHVPFCPALLNISISVRTKDFDVSHPVCTVSKGRCRIDFTEGWTCEKTDPPELALIRASFRFSSTSRLCIELAIKISRICIIQIAIDVVLTRWWPTGHKRDTIDRCWSEEETQRIIRSGSISESTAREGHENDDLFDFSLYRSYQLLHRSHRHLRSLLKIVNSELRSTTFKRLRMVRVESEKLTSRNSYRISEI